MEAAASVSERAIIFILPEALFHKAMDKEPVGIVVHAVGKTGVLHQLTGVIAQHDGDITSVEILDKIYGKRIIIVGGGAQVGQVAIGAVSEADRHNIRGEHISVDTIPLVGEQKLADAVRAVARLPRAKALVLAGALMGGEIEVAVREVRQEGLLVFSLNMAGSVPDAADLVISD